jgi:hypothetical protein
MRLCAFMVTEQGIYYLKINEKYHQQINQSRNSF